MEHLFVREIFHGVEELGTEISAAELRTSEQLAHLTLSPVRSIHFARGTPAQPNSVELAHARLN
jgi:hypothetical protein